MTFQNRFKTVSVTSLICIALVACGGGGSSSGNNQMTDTTSPPPTPASTSVDFGQTISDLVVTGGSVTLPDGRTYDADSAPIEMSDYMWDIDDEDVDEGPLDDVFSG